MESDRNYAELLKLYKELENKVAGFSSIEQELINTRDTLDNELILYKRLNSFVAKALTPLPDKSFFNGVCEAVVDIFEVECAVIFLKNNATSNIEIYDEGLGQRLDFEELSAFCQNWLNKPNAEQVSLFNTLHTKKGYIVSRGILVKFYNKEIDASIIVAGFIFEKMNGNYPNISINRQTIFGVFINYLNTIIANRANNIKIKETLNLISKSKVELEKLSLIATNTNSGVIISDVNGRVEWVNNAFSKLSGYKLEEIIGKKPREFLHGIETNIQISEKIGEGLRKMQAVEETVINYNKNGEKYYCQLQISPVFNEDGNLVNFIALQRDITRELNYQNLIIQSNSKFEIITTKSQIGVWEWDLVSNNTVWNDVLLEQYGITKIENVSFFDFWKSRIHPEDFNDVLSLTDQLINSKNDLIDLEYRIIRIDNNVTSYLKCTTVAERDNNGELLRLIGSSIDITERKKSEYEREQYINTINGLKQFYENVMSHLPTTIIVLDDNLKPIYSNSANKIDDLIYIKVIEAKELQRLVSFELEIIENEKYNLVSVLPNYINDKLKNIIIVMTDISDLKKFELEILEKNNELSKTNSELDSFVYSVSHDLRTPLLSLKGLLELIEESDNLPQEVNNFLEMAQQSVLRLDSTIQEILEYSRNSRLELDIECFNLLQLAEDVFNGVKYSAETCINFNIESNNDGYIYSDKKRIKVLLSNLISNAVKYRRRDIDNPYINIKLIAFDDKYEISIEDNGEGISNENQLKVFNMFYRASNSDVGTGLGLYICKEIIAKLNGEISLKSKLSLGSVFTIILPKPTQTH